MTRVLVVDDSPRLAPVIDNALATSGYDVVSADAQPRDALEHHDPDVVAIALEAGVDESLETAERLLAASPTPTLVIAGDGREEPVDSTDLTALDAVDVLRTSAHSPPAESVSADVASADAASAESVSADVASDESVVGDAIVDRIATLAETDVASLAAAHTAATARSIRAAGSDGRTVMASRTVSDGSVPNSTSMTGRSPSQTVSGPTTVERPTEHGETAPNAGPDDSTSSPNHSRCSQMAPCDSVSPSSPTVTSPVETPTIVVGASTGGPSLIERLCATLPGALEATVLVVQHMPADFTPRFAARLDAVSEYSVCEPQAGQPLQPETAFVAPGDRHLGITTDADGTRRITFVDDVDRWPTPSIDVTMSQVAAHTTGPLCGVVLSGMGRDGAAGIEAIDAAGGHTIAQNEATSSVFGIPSKAIETGCIDEVVPPTALVETIVDAIAGETNE